jgi:hypothetical protein
VSAITRGGTARALQNGRGMMVCDYTGSYFEPTPWADQACSAEESVPAGCPLHVVIGADLEPTAITAALRANDGTTTPLSSTVQLVDSVTENFVVPDLLACDCEPKPTDVEFWRYEVTVTGAQAGDTIEIDTPGVRGPLYTVTAAGPCPAPAWPTDFHVALACDMCMEPTDPIGDHSNEPGGCAAGGDPSLALLAALGALPLLARRRRWRNV